jgi:hypothetical protein
MKFPFVEDPKIGVKSVSITLLIISFLICIISISLSHYFLSCLPASGLSLLLFALCYLMYRLRKIDSFSLDVKTGEIRASDTNLESRIEQR